MNWHVYLVRCSDSSLYCGITTNLDRRINEHNCSPRGAAYTRGRRPVVLVWSKYCKNRSEAAKEEHRIKKLSKAEKELLTR